MRHPALQKALISLLIRNRDVEIRLFGARLSANTRSDVGYVHAYKVLRSSRTLREDPAVLLSLAAILAPDDTFVDIGANIGLFSAALARVAHLYPKVRFYAFEANPSTSVRLRSTLLGMPVTVHEVALSDRNATLEFSEGASSLSFGVRNQGTFQFNETSRKVEAVRLDEVDIAGDSLILKIDVEGHEREVLEGASGLFDARRIKAVYLDHYRDDGIVDFLHERGFTLYDGRTLEPGVTDQLLALREGFPPTEL
jgi:FkbM family methyltransferase